MDQKIEITEPMMNEARRFKDLQTKQTAKLILVTLDHYYDAIKVDEDEILRSASDTIGLTEDELRPFLRDMQIGEDSENILEDIEKLVRSKT